MIAFVTCWLILDKKTAGMIIFNKKKCIVINWVSKFGQVCCNSRLLFVMEKCWKSAFHFFQNVIFSS
jgi:hypothetical protein